ncbi:MAG: dihydrolipoyllysine-residue acetyltransferase [Gammaproteobacteria bacterium]|nr:dihydrolipoyllysine-residue acetyltransferase [Gammaproteobacteria bacterium]MDH3857136.1 dihydrolipoyllysine-residue acetyltransferase [Gammaproteobacteria bacterium]
MAENKTITLPDVGDFQDIEIIEILVAAGDEVEAEQSIIVLESDKATMEIPTPYDGTIESILVSVGDRLNEGDKIATLSASDGATEAQAAESAPASVKDSAPATAAVPDSAPVPEVRDAAPSTPDPSFAKAEASPGKTMRPHPGTGVDQADSSRNTMIHASPSIRRYARELGVNLEQVIASGAKGRIVKADVKAFVKSAMTGSAAPGATGISVGSIPEVDHSKFGEIETVALSRIQKISGAHLHRSWVNVPHVTQFDDADITELEAFRKSLAKEAEKKSVRLTPLVFLMKAVVSALQEFPTFNASLDARGENLILKKYFHIGIAVDTPSGLVVPVVRDVDQKGLFELAAELGEVSLRARDGKLSPTDMQGGCFTISSLGGIGGTYFTPIVNAPEVAILGVSRSKMQPVYLDGEFEPRLILPLGLSYDHRVIDGAQAARFTTFLSQVISDIRRILL